MKRLTADQMKAGFIGLGNMGSRIAQRLLDRGYQVSVYDRNRAQTEAVAAHGGVAAKNILELARTSDVVLSCLTNDEAVRSVDSGPDGVFAGARPGTVVLEMSTISPATSRELHQLGATREVDVLDVAISGSTPAAEAGTLTLLAGGDQKTISPRCESWKKRHEFRMRRCKRRRVRSISLSFATKAVLPATLR